MKRMTLVAALALSAAPAARAAGPAPVDPVLLAAAERFLAAMPADYHQVDPVAARRLIESAGPLVLDVREASELVASGRIAGSVHVPIRELPAALARLPADRSAPILVYCQVGYRGGMAVAVLRMLGYADVRNVRNGLDGWSRAGLPVEKGR